MTVAAPAHDRRPTRRRALALVAAAACLPLAGAARRTAPILEWRGTAMGADASIRLAGARSDAEAALAAVVGEIDRLESVLGLFRPESELVRLNRDGRLDAPAQDLVACLTLAGDLVRLTEGRFDPTVQVLFEAYAAWFAARPDGAVPPDAAAIAAARARVGFERVGIGVGTIELAPGTRLTLNGIAQGWVTDRAVDVLARHGFRAVLADLGEVRAAGPRPDGTPWRIALDGGGIVPLAQGAVAVSAPDGLRFRGGPSHHLFDPKTGRPADHWRRVAVLAPSAALADGLSTGLAAAGPEALARIAARLDGVAIGVTDAAGAERVFGAWPVPARRPTAGAGFTFVKERPVRPG